MYHLAKIDNVLATKVTGHAGTDVFSKLDL